MLLLWEKTRIDLYIWNYAKSETIWWLPLLTNMAYVGGFQFNKLLFISGTLL